ncbi:hypothetical protein [Malikia granosa]|uniref:hypothetical protein n=1 Tax=Malikia granosa TaxID=263067 RepID=UPI0011B08526|nr:hypothetical protein [Malikia granosa]
MTFDTLLQYLLGIFPSICLRVYVWPVPERVKAGPLAIPALAWLPRRARRLAGAKVDGPAAAIHRLRPGAPVQGLQLAEVAGLDNPYSAG